MTLHCPHCGEPIEAQIWLKSGGSTASNPGANVASNPAQMSISSKIYNQGYEPEFLEFWNVYPLHRGKRKAQISWLKSVKRLAQIGGSNREQAVAQILAGAIRYRDDPNRLDEFTKYAEGWLNSDGWEDDPLPARQNNGHQRESAAMRILREGGRV